MLVVSVTCALVGLFNTVAAEAQQAVKVARIGWLGDDRTRSPHLREAFLQGMRDLGYVEGKLERFPDLAAELVALKVDVIVASGGTRAVLAAKQATRPVPPVTPRTLTSASNGRHLALLGAAAEAGVRRHDTT